jgi:hypothetical protein
MNTKYTFIVAAMTIGLIGATVVQLKTRSQTKRRSIKRIQVIAQANDCSNGKLPLNVFYQNIDSQIQDDENVVALITELSFGEVEEEVIPVQQSNQALFFYSYSFHYKNM